MKVNFWQVLGFVLIVIGVVMFARKKTGPDDTVKPAPAPQRQMQTTPPTTTPSTAPVAP